MLNENRQGPEMSQYQIAQVLSYSMLMETKLGKQMVEISAGREEVAALLACKDKFFKVTTYNGNPDVEVVEPDPMGPYHYYEENGYECFYYYRFGRMKIKETEGHATSMKLYTGGTTMETAFIRSAIYENVDIAACIPKMKIAISEAIANHQIQNQEYREGGI